MLNPARLRVLRELHRHKTLSAVAETLSYSTSAVSQQLRMLEKELGVTLVEPAGRRLQLTNQGLILVEHAEKILDLLERAEIDVTASVDEPRGTVRLAAFQSAALTLVPAALAEVHRSYPQLQIEFEQGEPETTLPNLESGDFDLVITEEFPGIAAAALPGISTMEIMRDPLWLAMDASLASRLDSSADLLPQLADVGWAMEREDSAARHWALAHCRANGFDPRIVCASEDITVQLKFIQAGLAVALLPGLALASAATTVTRFPLSGSGHGRRILLAVREAAEKRTATMVVQRALQHIASDYPIGQPT